MDTRKLVVTNPAGMTAKGSADQLEKILVNICGCYTANDTAEAMRLGHLVRSGQTVKKKGWTLRLETRYTLYVAPGFSQCRLYLMPYPMRSGQHPRDLLDKFKDQWEEVGMLNGQLKVTYLDERLHSLHGELEGAQPGDYFELDEEFQFVDGPALVVSQGVA